jgi:hypothetical protein
MPSTVGLYFTAGCPLRGGRGVKYKKSFCPAKKGKKVFFPS